MAACNVCVGACTCECTCTWKCDNAWIHVHVSVAQFIVVSVWPMAGTLWWLLE